MSSAPAEPHERRIILWRNTSENGLRQPPVSRARARQLSWQRRRPRAAQTRRAPPPGSTGSTGTPSWAVRRKTARASTTPTETTRPSPAPRSPPAWRRSTPTWWAVAWPPWPPPASWCGTDRCLGPTSNILEAMDVAGGRLRRHLRSRTGLHHAGRPGMENHFECLWDLFRSIPSLGEARGLRAG